MWCVMMGMLYLTHIYEQHMNNSFYLNTFAILYILYVVRPRLAVTRAQVCVAYVTRGPHRGKK